jgi:hypothetical protein
MNLVSTLREMYSVPIGKRDLIMMLREIIAVYSENHA